MPQATSAQASGSGSGAAARTTQFGCGDQQALTDENQLEKREPQLKRSRSDQPNQLPFAIHLHVAPLFLTGPHQCGEAIRIQEGKWRFAKPGSQSADHKLGNGRMPVSRTDPVGAGRPGLSGSDCISSFTCFMQQETLMRIQGPFAPVREAGARSSADDSREGSAALLPISHQKWEGKHVAGVIATLTRLTPPPSATPPKVIIDIRCVSRASY